jgi:hypothetical protein
MFSMLSLKKFYDGCATVADGCTTTADGCATTDDGVYSNTNPSQCSVKFNNSSSSNNNNSNSTKNYDRQ